MCNSGVCFGVNIRFCLYSVLCRPFRCERTGLMKSYSQKMPEPGIKRIIKLKELIRSKSKSMMIAKTTSYVPAKQNIRDPCFLPLLICTGYLVIYKDPLPLSFQNCLILPMNHLPFDQMHLVLLTQTAI